MTNSAQQGAATSAPSSTTNGINGTVPAAAEHTTNATTQDYTRRWTRHLSEETKRRNESPLKAAFKHIATPGLISLGGGLPTPSLFPLHSVSVQVPQVGAWSEHEAANDGLTITMDKYRPKPKTTTSEHPIDLATTMQYGLGSGNPNFLHFLTEHTRMVHDPPYPDWTCIMTAGNTWALELCLRMLLNSGDTLMMEEYTFSSAIETVVPHNIKVVGMKMDDYGVCPKALESMLSGWDESTQGRKPRVMYIIPTGQNPTGSSIPPERRKEIYAIAQKHDLIILEDEPYYFLQMPEYDPNRAPNGDASQEQQGQGSAQEQLIASLVTSFLRLDTDGRVIRFDSFSKTIAPGTRCGWMTGAAQMLERATRHNEVTIQSPSGFSQIILYNMLALQWGHEGFFKWLRYIRHVYTERRDNSMRALDAYLPKGVARWTPPIAGMFFWVEIDPTTHPKWTGDYKEMENYLYAKLLEAKVLMIPGSYFLAERERKLDRLFFRGTFACVEMEACQQGVQRFGDMLKAEFNLS